MSLKNIIIVLFLLILIVGYALLKPEQKIQNHSSKNSIVLSTFALYDAAKHIGKDKFKLSSVLPFGSDAHSYELTPKKMAEIQDSSLFVYSGASLEPWISKISSPNMLDMSKYVNLIHLEEDHHHHHHHEDESHHEDEEVSHKEAIDPHYWLDINNMIKVAQKLTQEFVKLSPKNKDFFESNKNEYIKTLKEMDKRYKEELSLCKKDTIIVNHNAFSYLGKTYNFHIESINGLSTESMPSPDDVKHILHEIKEKNVSIIFFESFASDKLIKSIAKDVNVKVDTLQPLGNITKDEQNLTYAEIMDKNIRKIKQALECR
ncbi:zinc ABC transporter substrate-binding protein [Sulfurimonas lithotrophica]|uniref:Zinc ABC transporter substrate-binding protein n=1 Tax=Sulfurimonas lithotrophica TaxID=2590022 RepID=A0A5P8NXR8_9BACT|nr:metal ABC transporter substrate-binding protein [Sulfurimonas lithotrophica]QFR48222.1 zinc ABC transporter substrate-binding protein [Sulfurimonas lithotrophica]